MSDQDDESTYNKLPDEFLCDGGMWEEHDGWLVGDEKGLRKLIVLAEKALQDGEAEEDICDFQGVRCLDTEVFVEEFEKDKSEGSSCTLGLAIIAFGVGIYTILKWIFQLIF